MTKAEIQRARVRDAITTGLVLYFAGLLILIQQGLDAPLVDDFKGLNAAMLAVFAVAFFQWWRAARLIVEGR